MKVGFIDHHLNNYHANKFHSLLTGNVGQGEVEIVAAYESDPQGEDWCAAHKVTRAASAQEVVDKSDAIIVMAPDNIATHLELGKAAYVSGKPTVVDKCLSTTVADAKQILEIAGKHNTPIMSSSALRFSVEIEQLLKSAAGKPLHSIFSRGFGHWRGYGVHSIAPTLRLFGPKVTRLIDTGKGQARIITLDNGTDRALIEVREADNQFEAFPWVLGATVEGRIEMVTVKLFDEFYENQMKHAVEFFKSRQSPIGAQEMLAVVAVEEGAEESFAKGGEWVTLNY